MPRKRGVGDFVGESLASIRIPWLIPNGITPETYRAWKVRHGFADACNCAERKERLNRFGRWIGKPLRAAWAWRKQLPPPPPAE